LLARAITIEQFNDGKKGNRSTPATPIAKNGDICK
jgi:hypothetical protein